VTLKFAGTVAPDFGAVITGCVDVVVVVVVVVVAVFVSVGVEVAVTDVEAAGTMKSIQASPTITRSKIMITIHQVEFLIMYWVLLMINHSRIAMTIG
jgi:hypothetical protein